MSFRLPRRTATLRQLEIIQAVSEHETISAAAEALSLTQPNVSMQLKKLADTVGLPLYDQIGRRIRFTDAGRTVLASAREVLSTLESLDDALADFKGVRKGHLRLSVVTTSKYFIPHLLGGFCHEYPDVEIELNVAKRRDVLERLAGGIDDFCVFSQPPADEKVQLFKFLPNPLVAIAPYDHPLATGGTVALSEFANWPFLHREPGSGTRYAIEQHFRQHEVPHNIKMTIESAEAIKHAVMAGLGVSIVSTHTMAFGGHRGLVEIDVETLPIVPHWHLAKLKAKRLSLVAQAFLDYVETNGRQNLVNLLLEEYPQHAALFSD